MKKNGKEIDEHGTVRYYKDGRLHRTDGPAAEYTSGTKVWFINGERHRTDGPAMEWYNGWKSWYLNGIEYYEEETYKIELRNLKLQRIKELLK
jgi:hypothetical protein